MVRLLVAYGHPTDPKAFDQYYYGTHLPIAKKIKGFTRWTVGRVLGTPDGKPAPFYYMADLFAENRKAMEAILASPEGQAAVNDVPKFATGGASFFYTDLEQLV
jgi:uncharacterized protein (TIGR02118 family)